MTLEELLASNPDAKAEYETALRSAVEPLTRKQKELLDETKAAKKTATELQSALAELGDIDGLKKIKNMFEQNEELKLFAEGKHDEVFSKRTERLQADFQKKLDAATTEREQALQRAKAFEAKVLEARVMNDALQVPSLNHAYIEDILMHARAKFTLDDNGNAVAMQDGEIIVGKDGKSPYTPAEWLADRDVTGRWHKAEGGAGAVGNAGTKSSKNTLTRTQFDGLSVLDRAAFAKGGGTITD